MPRINPPASHPASSDGRSRSAAQSPAPLHRFALRPSHPLALAAAWAALAFAMLFQGLGSFGLLGPDEPRYAAIAAAMLRRRDFVTPVLWGRPWFEKPVLYYWLAALSDAASHVGADASRFPNALFAALMSLALWAFLGRVHSARAGRLAAFISLTTAFVFAFGRAATTDMTLTAPLAAGLMALYLWWQSRPAPARARLWLALAAAALGLAVLAKGPVAIVLAGGTLLAFAATQTRWRGAFSSVTPLSVAVFFAVSAPWYIALEWRHPGFFKIFFLQQNLERFATNRYQHPQPFWFYLPVLLLGLFPWSAWLGLPLAAGLRRLRRLGWRAWDGAGQPLKFFLFFWLAVPVVFFSLSHSKLPGYILPSIPAAIALIAIFAAERWDALPRSILAFTALLAGLVPAALLLAPWLLAPRDLRPPLSAMLVIAFGGRSAWPFAAGAVLLLLLLALRRRTNPRAKAMGATALAAAVILIMAGAVSALTHPPLSTALDHALGGRVLASQLRAQCDGGLPQACGPVPLYVWRLGRGQLYAAQFAFNAPFTPWPAAASAPAPLPQQALVVTARTSALAFAAAYGKSRRLARLTRFTPSGPPPPWVVLRLGPLLAK